jgi:hypothetical protein
MKKLLLLTFASSVLFCDVALAVQPHSYTDGRSSDTSIAQSQNESNISTDKLKSTPAKIAIAKKYDAFMKAGYAAYSKKDYKTALSNFQSALDLRPKNVYATKAIQNTEKRLAGK